MTAATDMRDSNWIGNDVKTGEQDGELEKADVDGWSIGRREH